ncbi:hypothetical protein [Pseudoteredinibacter isoporae]|uniref:hypothetical protein n=1 Tax=Pseudoteredinibacter isoporae TaxID=570281 RepID=UPI003340D553
MAQTEIQWHKFRVIGVIEQGQSLPNARHIRQSDSRWYALYSLDLEPNIQLKVPAQLIETSARREGAIVEAAYDKGQLRGRFMLPVGN